MSDIKQYIGSQEHWEDSVNSDYDKREKRDKEQEDNRPQELPPLQTLQVGELSAEAFLQSKNIDKYCGLVSEEKVKEWLIEYASQPHPVNQLKAVEIIQELIEQYESTAKDVVSESGFNYDENDFPSIIKAKQFLQSQLKGDLPVLDNWIKTNENDLPKNGQRIMFYVGGNEPIRIGSFLIQDQWDRPEMFCDGAFFHKELVTHWQPLPPLPQPPIKH